MLKGFVPDDREREETPDEKVDCFVYPTNRIKISTEEVTNVNDVKVEMLSEFPVKLKTPSGVDVNNMDENVLKSGVREDFSRIIISFSLGDGAFDLATPNVFRNIKTQIAYKGKEGLERIEYKDKGAFVIVNTCDEDISFSELQMDFQNIVSDTPPGVTQIVIDYKNVFIEDQPYSFTRRLRLEKYLEKLKIKNFRATKWTVGRNRTTTLVWEIAGAEKYKVEIDPGQILPGERTNELEVSVDETKNFTISVMDENGEVKDWKELTVYVEKQIVNSFAADQFLVDLGEEVTLKWKTLYCERIEITADDGMCAEIPVEQLDEGELKVYPVNDTKYTLKCYGKGETVTRDLSIQVESVQLKDFYIVCGDKKDTALSIKW
ncbi:MAG: hypothetical protein J5898_09600, partial [Lachnospiraceae bacterium]|nr:hypothetical protein [Lachnospiraceae bacterium]